MDLCLPSFRPWITNSCILFSAAVSILDRVLFLRVAFLLSFHLLFSVERVALLVFLLLASCFSLETGWCSGDSIVLDLMCAYLLVLCSALIITLPFLAGTVDKHCLVLFGNQFSFELQAEEVVSDHYKSEQRHLFTMASQGYTCHK